MPGPASHFLPPRDQSPPDLRPRGGDWEADGEQAGTELVQATIQLGHKWTPVPSHCGVPVGSQIRVCPITERVQAREPLPPLDLTPYVGEGETYEQVLHSWNFWSPQIK